MKTLTHKLNTSLSPLLLAFALLMFITFMCCNASAQTAKRDTSAVKYMVINKVTHRLYVGAKGGRYIMVTSRNGNVYKKYFSKK